MPITRVMKSLARMAWLSLPLAFLAGCGGLPARTSSLAWKPVPLTTDASFDDIWFADDRHGWVVGGGFDIKGGLIGRTQDGGVTWTYASGFVGPWPGQMSFNFTSVQFFDSLSGCVAASGGQIFRTDDGGANWRIVRNGGGELLSDVSFVDRSTGWAVGPSGILQTTDGGENWLWEVRSRSENGYLGGNAIQFLDRSLGWLAGRGTIMKSTDGGMSWSSVTLPLAPSEHPHLFDLQFADARHGWAVGENGTILATSDGGWTWTRQINGIPAPQPRALQIVRRANGVDTLDLEGPPAGLCLMAVRFVDASHGWTAGFFPGEGRSVVLRTDDGGATWHEEGEAQGQELRGLFVTAEGSGWSVGDRVRPGRQVLLRRSPPAL